MQDNDRIFYTPYYVHYSDENIVWDEMKQKLETGIKEFAEIESEYHDDDITVELDNDDKEHIFTIKIIINHELYLDLLREHAENRDFLEDLFDYLRTKIIEINPKVRIIKRVHQGKVNLPSLNFLKISGNSARKRRQRRRKKKQSGSVGASPIQQRSTAGTSPTSQYLTEALKNILGMPGKKQSRVTGTSSERQKDSEQQQLVPRPISASKISSKKKPSYGQYTILKRPDDVHRKSVRWIRTKNKKTKIFKPSLPTILQQDEDVSDRKQQYGKYSLLKRPVQIKIPSYQQTETVHGVLPQTRPQDMMQFEGTFLGRMLRDIVSKWRYVPKTQKEVVQYLFVVLLSIINYDLNQQYGYLFSLKGGMAIKYWDIFSKKEPVQDAKHDFDFMLIRWDDSKPELLFEEQVQMTKDTIRFIREWLNIQVEEKNKFAEVKIFKINYRNNPIIDLSIPHYPRIPEGRIFRSESPQNTTILVSPFSTQNGAWQYRTTSIQRPMALLFIESIDSVILDWCLSICRHVNKKSIGSNAGFINKTFDRIIARLGYAIPRRILEYLPPGCLETISTGMKARYHQKKILT